MSVIVKRLKSSSMEIYVKGAPEVMPEICDPSSCKTIVFSWVYKGLLQSRLIMTICFLIILVTDSESSPLPGSPSKA